MRLANLLTVTNLMNQADRNETSRTADNDQFDEPGRQK